nr:MAG TPA: hypothetical protein [Caudoviricetes sp.]
MEMTHYQSFLFSLIVVLQILLTTYSFSKEDFEIFAAGIITLCLLVLFVSTLGGI